MRCARRGLRRRPAAAAILSTMAPREHTTLEVSGQELRLSSPGRVYFPAHGGRDPITRLDLAEN